MILELLIPHSFGVAILWLLAGILLRLLVNKYGQGLNKIPGPWLAGFTDLWRLFIVRGRRAQEVHIELHKKYGPMVRLGPRAVSVADPEAIKIIYSPSSGYSKVNFRTMNSHMAELIANTTRTVGFLPSAAGIGQGEQTRDHVQHCQ